MMMPLLLCLAVYLAGTMVRTRGPPAENPLLSLLKFVAPAVKLLTRGEETPIRRAALRGSKTQDVLAVIRR